MLPQNLASVPRVQLGNLVNEFRRQRDARSLNRFANAVAPPAPVGVYEQE